MIEEWRDIPGYPYYQASNLGRIRTLDKVVKCNHGHRTIKGKILSQYISKRTGYLHISFNRTNVSAHRLVALSWCDGHFDGAVVDHLNGVRDDNRPENLEWVTYSENCARPYRLGRRVNPFLGVKSGMHPKSKAVVSTCMRTGERRIFESAMDAVREGFDISSWSGPQKTGHAQV